MNVQPEEHNVTRPSKSKGLRRLSVSIAAAIAASSLPITSAYAQLEEIIVLARKVEENLQDVPVSVTAVTGFELTNAGLTEFPEIASITPNFNVRADDVRGSVGAALTIRGQTSTTTDLSIDQAVGININGAPVTRGTNLFGNLFDIEQVEIVRGPQGTLFGKNTTGGTVIVRTTAPKLDEYSGYLQADFGNFGRINVEGVGNIPLGENSALRFGAAFTNRDGFGDGVGLDGSLTGNELADDDEEFFRASYLYQPSDDFSLRINADHHTVDENPVISRVLLDGTLVIVPGVVEIPIARRTPGDSLFLGSDLRDTDPELSAEETNINATIELGLGWADLTSITSYRDQETFTVLNYAVSADIPIGQESELIAQEVRLAGGTDRLNWQTGFFFSQEDGEDFNDVGGRGQLTGVENDSFSVFGHGSYDFTDQLSLTLGARWTDEERFVDLLQLGNVPVQGQTEADLIAEGTTTENEADFDAFSWTVGLDYRWTSDFLTYGSISRGFRSGGIDGDNDIGVVVEPEFVVNYEVGFKADLLDDTLRFNTSFWYSDYTDIQLVAFAVDSDNTVAQGVPSAILRNAAEATLRGFESELQWFPTDDLTFNLGVGYTDGDFDEFLEEVADPANPGSTIIVDSSNDPIGGPEWQFSLLGRYEFDVGQNTSGGLQLTYTYLDEQVLADPALSARFEQGEATVASIDLLNAQLDFDLATWGGINVAFWGKNILDEEYFSTGFAIEALGLPLAQGITGEPRTYGIRVRKDF